MFMIRMAAAFLMTALITARGEPLLLESFDRVGSLADSQPAVGNVWTAIPGGSGVLSKVSGTLRISSAVSQEVQTTFAAISAGSVYAGFDLKVISAPTTPWLLPLTFRGQNTSGGNMVGRVFVNTGTSAGTFRIGIDNDKEASVWWTTELNAGASYRIVLGFRENGSADVTTLWVNPASETDPSISEVPENVTGEIYGLRVNAYHGIDGALEIDDLIVTSDFKDAATVSRPSPAPTPNLQEAKIVEFKKQLKALKAKLKKEKEKENSRAMDRLRRKIRNVISLLKELQ
jgi:hypothetical protein